MRESTPTKFRPDTSYVTKASPKFAAPPQEQQMRSAVRTTDQTFPAQTKMHQEGTTYSTILKQLQETNKKIFVKPIPPEKNTEAMLMAVFSKIGAVQSIECAPAKKIAFVEFHRRVLYFLLAVRLTLVGRCCQSHAIYQKYCWFTCKLHVGSL
jgi:hypothetical protein